MAQGSSSRPKEKFNGDNTEEPEDEGKGFQPCSKFTKYTLAKCISNLITTFMSSISAYSSLNLGEWTNYL
jgi:hypothetical protein